MMLSVVIPCYNAARTLGAQLDALAGQQWSGPWEIIVANNRSTDASVSVVEDYQKRMPNLRLVDASEKRGPAHARNRGVAAAYGDALVFCDADDVVGEGWLAAMGEALVQHDFVAGRFDIERLNPLWIQRSRANGQRDGLAQYRYPPYLPHSGSGCLGVKRAMHESMGGFDESMFILEDTDYCWRLQLAGVELHFVPGAEVHVRYRDSLRGIYAQARNYAEYNVLLYKRYRPFGMPELPFSTSKTAWRRFVRKLPHIRTREDLASSIWAFGWRMGRLRGSIKHRVLSL